MDISVGRYVDLVVEFLEAVEYGEPEGSVDERVETLRYVYRGTMEYFTRPDVQDIPVDRELLEIYVRTITRMTVLGWENLSRDTLLPLTIHFLHTVIEDDLEVNPFLANTHPADNFIHELVGGGDQVHPVHRSIFASFPDLLRHYGKFAQLALLRYTLDFLQGTWVEGRRFQGFPGSGEYPMWLRRLTGMGGFCAISLFPADQFDEDRQFGDVVTVIAYLIPIVPLVNDVFSFYKEKAGADGDFCLVNSRSATSDQDTEQVLRGAVRDSVHAVQQLRHTLGGRQSAALKTANDFLRGYIRWHLSDERYQMKELGAQCGTGSRSAVKFQRFREIACRASCIDLVDFQTL
ncbi:hypothetical protein [Streptomyces syringium]|uniref:Trichodiene synthase n=1 Tax=Streptomyces syringium TaxID=76729 RepID=A0ABS4YBK5_9ACTN|nr:hypothetical protein [Streptomyces syringium]MBP2406181.1 trichodiene synthase [Streptomyces syringium]